jgi:hypothetical protein
VVDGEGQRCEGEEGQREVELTPGCRDLSESVGRRVRMGPGREGDDGGNGEK